MICKLCRLDKKLVKAHVIPNFMYSGLFNKTHDIISVNLSNPKSRKKIQTGYFDKSILCESCDNEIIGSYERYAHKVLFDEQYTNEDNLKSKITTAEDGVKSFTINLKYKEFKLFLLSILWRASITELSFFNRVSLKKQDEELIRGMILNGEPESSDIFPISMFKAIPPRQHQSKLIIDPVTVTSDGHDMCIFFINGYFYNFILSKNTNDVLFSGISIKEDNIIVVPVLENQDALDYMNSFTQQQIWK